MTASYKLVGNENISILTPKPDAKVYVSADVHGNLSALENSIKTLKMASDDIYIIAGDLIDRGHNSAGVIELLMKTPNLLSIRGNHEDLFIKFVNLKIQHQKAQAALTEYADKYTSAQLANSAEFEKLEEHANKIEDDYENHRILYCNYNGGGWVQFITDEKLIEYKNFLEKLPSMIIVNNAAGNPSAVIGHAGIPVTDADLQNRINNNNLTITDYEKFYLAWARPQGNEARGDVLLKNVFRKLDSVLGIVGHNINGGIRRDTNEVNLDIATYDTNAMLALDVFNNSCHLIIHKQIDPKLYLKLLLYANQINYHLKASKQTPHQKLDEWFMVFMDLTQRFLENAHANNFELLAKMAEIFRTSAELLYCVPNVSDEDKIDIYTTLLHEAEANLNLVNKMLNLEKQQYDVSEITTELQQKLQEFQNENIDLHTFFKSMWDKIKNKSEKVDNDLKTNTALPTLYGGGFQQAAVKHQKKIELQKKLADILKIPLFVNFAQECEQKIKIK